MNYRDKLEKEMRLGKKKLILKIKSLGPSLSRMKHFQTKTQQVHCHGSKEIIKKERIVISYNLIRIFKTNCKG